MSEHKEPVIFITYDWNDTSDLFIQNLQSSIKGVEFKIDKKDIDNFIIYSYSKSYIKN